MARWSRNGKQAPESQRVGLLSRMAAWTDGIWDGMPSQYGGGGSAGGIRADGGFGSSQDKTARATWGLGYMTRPEMETLRRTSWAARRVTDTVVDDAFNSWRTFVSESDTGNVEARMEEAEQESGAKVALRRAWIAARLHGTACVLMVTTDAPMDTELDPERIRPGDLKALHVFDHWSMAAAAYDEDLASPDFAMPAMWHISTRFGQQLTVHPSRLLLFYGVPPLTSMGTENASLRGWWAGTSVLESVLRTINADELASSATAHGLVENAMVVLKSPGLTERSVGDPKMVQAKLLELNRAKGISMLLADEGDEVLRLASPASGAAPAVIALGKRVAQAAGIPETRFLGVPGAGFASSEPEHLAYSEFIRSLQESVLAPHLEVLDVVLARNVGLARPPEYEFVPLVTLAEAQAASTASTRVDTASKLRAGKLATLEEARKWLREDETFEDALEEEVPDDLESDDGEEAGGPGAPFGSGDEGPADEGDAGAGGEEGDGEGEG